MRFGALIGLAAVASIGLAACGGDEPQPRKLPERVRIELTAPSDTAIVNGGTVEVRGRVTPAASRVRVLGRSAQVVAGAFTAVVPVEPGANVIDVAASARGRLAAFAALRIVREDLIGVPSLVGDGAEDAEAQLRSLGLRVETEDGGGLFDGLLPGDPTVCDQEPAAGADVRRGTTVRILVARSC